MIELCGGHNIFADIAAPAASVSMESVVPRDPRAIVTGSNPGATVHLAAWQRWPQVSAVKTRSLFSIPGDLLARATPRILDGGNRLCADLQNTRKRAVPQQR